MTGDDDQLTGRLREIADRADPVPGLVTGLARAALSTRRTDEMLAELLADSADGDSADGDVTDGAMAVARGESMRLLSFACGAVAIELQAHVQDGTAALRGLVNGAVGDVIVQTPARELRVPVDENGWFTADGLPAGLLRLRLRAGEVPVTTSWVTI